MIGFLYLLKDQSRSQSQRFRWIRVTRALGTRLLKDGAYFCYCAYVLGISRYSSFLRVVPTNTGIFLRGLKLCRERSTYQVILVSKKKIGGNHTFFIIDNKASIPKKKTPYIALYFTAVLDHYCLISSKNMSGYPQFFEGGRLLFSQHFQQARTLLENKTRDNKFISLQQDKTKCKT